MSLYSVKAWVQFQQLVAISEEPNSRTVYKKVLPEALGHRGNLYIHKGLYWKALV